MIGDSLPFHFVLLNGDRAEGNSYLFNDGDFISTIGLCGFLICYEGEIKISHNGTIYKMHKGDVYLNTSSINLRLLLRSDDFKGVVVVSKIDFVLPLVHKANSPQNILYLRNNPCISLCAEDFSNFKIMVTNLYNDYIGEFNDDNENTQSLEVELMKSKLNCLCYQLFILFFKNQPVKPLDLNRGDEVFHKFMVDLNEHFKTERSVEFYAELQKISVRYFSKVIKQKSGISAAQWIDQAIIAECKQMLEVSTLSIKEIGMTFGFENQSFFGKFFKKHTGMSPMDYRKKSR